MTSRGRSVARTTAMSKADEARLPAPSAREAQAIIDATARREKRHPRARTGIKISGENRVNLVQPHTDQQGWKTRLEDALGTCSRAFVNTELIRILNVLRDANGIDPDAIDAVFAVLDGQKPKDEIEALLIVQMAVTHALTMKKAGLLNRVETIQQQDSAALALSRLTRTFTAQVEALTKLRRGGEQKVTVEHVHVYPGGQAIVGSVTHTGGPGAILGNQEQPHAANDSRALAIAGCGPMRSQDPQREAMPVANCEGQEALPDARRGGGIRGANGRA